MRLFVSVAIGLCVLLLPLISESNNRHIVELKYDSATGILLIPVNFGSTKKFMILDTGASYSTLPLTALELYGAKRLHITKEARVGNGDTISIDMFLMEEITLGECILKNVIFAAVPHADGLFGFQILEKIMPLELRKSDEIDEIEFTCPSYE